MKRLCIWIALFLVINLFQINAQTHKTIHVPQSGQLRAQLTEQEANEITHLTLTGSINAIDFKVIRDEFPNLEFLDLTNASIKLYVGKKGTYPERTYVYPMDCIPAHGLKDKKTLKHVILSPSLKNIEDAAFLGCDNLKVCQMKKKKAPNLLPNALNDSITTIFVPLGTRDEYWNKPKWKPFNLVEGEVVSANVNITTPGTLDEQIRNLGKRPEQINFLTIKGTLNDEDFKNIRDNMLQLTGIDMRDMTNKVIPEYTFSQKKYLMFIDLPQQLEAIGSRAFSGCIHISGELSLPNSVKDVASDAFLGCTRITKIILRDKELIINQ